MSGYRPQSLCHALMFSAQTYDRPSLVLLSCWPKHEIRDEGKRRRPSIRQTHTPNQALCNGDYMRPLRLEIWDWDRDGDHDCMGRLTTSLQQLLEGQGRDMDLEVRIYGERVCAAIGVNL